VDHWKMSLGSFGVSIKHQWFVRVAQHLQIIIGFPAVAYPWFQSYLFQAALPRARGFTLPLVPEPLVGL